MRVSRRTLKLPRPICSRMEETPPPVGKPFSIRFMQHRNGSAASSCDQSWAASNLSSRLGGDGSRVQAEPRSTRSWPRIWLIWVNCRPEHNQSHGHITNRGGRRRAGACKPVKQRPLIRRPSDLVHAGSRSASLRWEGESRGDATPYPLRVPPRTQLPQSTGGTQ